jgi:hypothetical protein
MWPLAAGRSGREDRKAHLDRTILEMDPLEQDWMEGVEGRRSLKLAKDSLLEVLLELLALFHSLSFFS